MSFWGVKQEQVSQIEKMHNDTCPEPAETHLRTPGPHYCLFQVRRNIKVESGRASGVKITSVGDPLIQTLKIDSSENVVHVGFI